MSYSTRMAVNGPKRETLTKKPSPNNTVSTVGCVSVCDYLCACVCGYWFVHEAASVHGKERWWPKKGSVIALSG